MFATTKLVEFASAPLAVAAAFLSLIDTNTAHAQIVGNGSFEVPNVSGDQGGLVQHVNPALTGPGTVEFSDLSRR